MDGSPSASDPNREALEPAEERSRVSDVDRELNHLRARAYGPHADIEADPVARARLIDLEAAHLANTDAGHGLSAAAAASRTAATAEVRIAMGQALPMAGAMNEMRPASSQSFVRLLGKPVTAAWSGGWFIAASIVVVIIFILSLSWVFGPRPDATLHLTVDETSSDLLDVLDNQGWSSDVSTLRQFESFQDVDVWSIQNGQGYVCLVAWDRGSGRFETQCVPPRTELALYATVPAEATGGFGGPLPEGSFVSLHLRANTVDVYVHHPQTAD